MPEITLPSTWGLAENSAHYLESSLGKIPEIALILGTGWDAILEGRNFNAGYMDFRSIPNFPVPRVPGHEGHVGVVDTVYGEVLVQVGRAHFYEGYSMLEACFPILAYALSGVRKIILFSAAGGLNPAYILGDFIIVDDHILLFGENPLRGITNRHEKSVHVSASSIYQDDIKEAIEKSLPQGSRVERGVYAYVPGPSYETGAEAALLRIFGADLVGMSVAPEALIAAYAGLKVGALSCISNVLLPQTSSGITHEFVLNRVRESVGELKGFLDSLIERVALIA
ncbi:MAG: purine-nucleoside phosphorylase [Actinomycetota bacterium]|nr:purine-nucleoside phosphorylase [Actinomycetota bacterium]